MPEVQVWSKFRIKLAYGKVYDESLGGSVVYVAYVGYFVIRYRVKADWLIEIEFDVLKPTHSHLLLVYFFQNLGLSSRKNELIAETHQLHNVTVSLQ